jgi:hypothetical protein
MKCLALLFCVVLLSFTSCHQGPVCPAYNSVHSDRNYGYNPNNADRAEKNNKADIEARKKAELSPKRSKRGKTSLFPKGMIKR